MTIQRDRAAIIHMIERAERILARVGEDRAAFDDDLFIQDAVMRNLEVIGEAAKRVSAELREAHPEVPWRRVAGLRDVLVHGYDKVVPAEVWAVVAGELPRVLDALRRIARQKGWT